MSNTCPDRTRSCGYRNIKSNHRSTTVRCAKDQSRRGSSVRHGTGSQYLGGVSNYQQLGQPGTCSLSSSSRTEKNSPVTEDQLRKIISGAEYAAAVRFTEASSDNHMTRRNSGLGHAEAANERQYLNRHSSGGQQRTETFTTDAANQHHSHQNRRGSSAVHRRETRHADSGSVHNRNREDANDMVRIHVVDDNGQDESSNSRNTVDDDDGFYTSRQDPTHLMTDKYADETSSHVGRQDSINATAVITELAGEYLKSESLNQDCADSASGILSREHSEVLNELFAGLCQGDDLFCSAETLAKVKQYLEDCQARYEHRRECTLIKLDKLYQPLDHMEAMLQEGHVGDFEQKAIDAIRKLREKGQDVSVHSQKVGSKEKSIKLEPSVRLFCERLEKAMTDVQYQKLIKSRHYLGNILSPGDAHTFEATFEEPRDVYGELFGAWNWKGAGLAVLRMCALLLLLIFILHLMATIDETELGPTVQYSALSQILALRHYYGSPI